MRKMWLLPVAVLLVARSVPAQSSSSLSPAVRKFVTVEAPVVALTHVQVIDGTGAAPLEDQTIIVEKGKIVALGSAGKTPVPAGAKVLELPGHTVIPGLVGMHDHLFYPSLVPSSGDEMRLFNEMGFSAPRLYLACGITSTRTTGSIEPYTDLSLKKFIDEGKMPGPKIHVTGPYLEGPGAFTPQMHELTGPDDARKTVDYWASQGVTSFKAYTRITRAELAAAIGAVHKRGLKITGHFCSVGFREAAALGIDGVEHGIMMNSDLVPGKAPDACPGLQQMGAAVLKLNVESGPIQEVIRDLVRHRVAVTSTLPVFETLIPNRPPVEQRVLDAMAHEARVDYLTIRARVAEGAGPSWFANVDWTRLLNKEMQFEHAFVKAGGLLIAGSDPAVYGGILPGFGDQREVELLVEAGFTPVEAIRIASANGAEWLGESERIGRIAPGKQADLVVLHGDPSARISDIKKVTIVFKDGVGYDSAKLVDSVRGSVGLR